MAKWGEGDPRWIVEERPDATNVNNWHWTERDASSWSKDQIKELFIGTEIKSDGASITIYEIEKCEGEASANNRKGKLIFFYEWILVLKWSGTVHQNDQTFEGNVTIPNLSEENEINEIDMQVTIKDNVSEAEFLKEIMIKEGKPIIRSLLKNYIDSLEVEFSKGMILPPKDINTGEKIKNLSSGFNKKVSMQPVVSNCESKHKVVDVTTIEVTEKFQCRAHDLYEALTRIEMVTAFTRGQVKLESVSGGAFELFGGNITGNFVELIPGEKIVQKWRCKQWPLEHYSTVSMTFNQKSDHTELNVVQTDVPKSDSEVTKQNWNRYYWNSIKQTFGFGVLLH